MSGVQIIGLPQSNYVWAVRIDLAEKGVDHENIPPPPHTPEAVAVHPIGKIPVLRHGAVALGARRWADDRRQTSSQRLSRSLARMLTVTAPRKVEFHGRVIGHRPSDRALACRAGLAGFPGQLPR